MSEPRRVVVVTESFHPAVDGATATTRHVVDGLLDRGRRVLLVAPGPGLASYRGTEVLRVVGERSGRQVREAVHRFRADLVHVTAPGRLGRTALKQARRAGIPTVTVQTAPVGDLPAPVWQARVADRSDRLLATSSWLAGHLGRLGVTAEVWRPGVDPDAFRPSLREPALHAHWSRPRRGDRPLAPDRPLVVVGYAGRLEPVHEVERLVELTDLPGIRLVVIGDGPERDRLRRRLPRARFTGHLDTGDLGHAVASLDLLVHPGRQESCCHPLREAAASGVPVVAAGAGGAAGLVRPLETGLLFDPAERVSFVRAVASLAGDTRRRQLGTRARELALARSWRDAVTELDAVHHAAALVTTGADTPVPAA
jgi:phosphatidylinositol alpha 1,6-mannosyltransferase